MPRSKGSKTHEGFVRQLKRGKYQGCITVNGKEIRRILASTNERDALKEWVDVRKGILKKNPPKEIKPERFEKTPFENAIERHFEIERLTRVITSRLEKEYRYNWKRFTDYCTRHGLKWVEEVSEEIADGFIGEMIQEKKRKNETMHKAVAQLHGVLGNVLPRGTKNPFDDKMKITAEDGEGYIHSDLGSTLEKKLIEAAEKYDQTRGKDEGWADLFILAANTGLRLKDCCYFNMKSVNIFDEIPHIVLRPFKSATKKANKHEGPIDCVTIPISLELKKMLERHLMAIVRDGGDLFPKIKKFHKNGNVGVHLQRIFKLAGIDTTQLTRGQDGRLYKTSFHSFRVEVASRLGSAGVPLLMASKILGHGTEVFKRYFRAEIESIAPMFGKAFQLKEEKPIDISTMPSETMEDFNKIVEEWNRQRPEDIHDYEEG